MHEHQALSILLSSDYTTARHPGGREQPLATVVSELDGEGLQVRLEYQGALVVIWGQTDQSHDPEPIWYVRKERRLDKVIG